MDGNRGAKGSIKDRLISMLYRIRYAKKIKKEEEYEIAKKERQVEYLKKLIDLHEHEDISILDSKDRVQLDKVKFTANYRLTNNGFVLSKKGISEENIQTINVDEVTNSNTDEVINKRKIVGIDPNEITTESNCVDLELQKIEYKTSELDEKVDLKKEIKKTKNEIVILEEVDKFIKKSKETLEEISEDVDALREMSKKKNQNADELEIRYKKLKEKVDKLKAQYEAVKDKYDLSEFTILESIKLIDNISEYKSRASINEMDMMIKVCKKEITKIESITIEYQETTKVGENIDEIKLDHAKIKVKFHKSKSDLNKLKTKGDELTEEVKYQEKIIDDMYKEASYFERTVSTDLVYTGYKNMFSSLLKIVGGVLTLPFSGASIFGVALGNTMINRGLKSINKSFYPFEFQKTIKYSYKDIANKILEVKDKVEYTNLIISDNLNEIKKVKENFKKYVEYNKVLPDYEDTFKKLEKLEEKLKIQQEKMSKMNEKLDKEKEMNSEKMKKVLYHRENDKNTKI